MLSKAFPEAEVEFGVFGCQKIKIFESEEFHKKLKKENKLKEALFIVSRLLSHPQCRKNSW